MKRLTIVYEDPMSQGHVLGPLYYSKALYRHNKELIHSMATPMQSVVRWIGAP